MKTWIYWHDHIIRLFKQLDPDSTGLHLPNLPSKKSSAILLFISNMQDKCVNEVDTAVAQYAETEEVIALSEEARYFMNIRAHMAYQFIQPLLIRKRGYISKLFIPPPETGTTHREIWLWLLDDLWKEWGKSQYYRELEKDVRSGWCDSGSIWNKQL